MELETDQLLAFILKNSEELAQLKLEVIKQAKETRLWMVSGLVAAIPIAIFIHKQLHPIEHFIGERGKEIDRLLAEAKKLIL